MTKWFSLLIASLLLMGIVAAEVCAHNYNNGYSYVRIYKNTVQYELLLPHPIMLQYDSDRNGEITDDELERQKVAIATYMRDQLELFNDKQKMEFELLSIKSAIQQSTEDPIVKFLFKFISNTTVERLTIHYNIMFNDIDPGHQNYIQLYKDDVLVSHRVVEKNGGTMDYVPDGQAQLSLGSLGNYLLLGLQFVVKSVYFWLFSICVVTAAATMGKPTELAFVLCIANLIGFLVSDRSGLAIPPAALNIVFAVVIVYLAACNLLSRMWSWRLPVSIVLGLVHGMSSFAAVSAIGIHREYKVIALLLYVIGMFLGLAGVAYVLFTLLVPLRKFTWLRR